MITVIGEVEKQAYERSQSPDGTREDLGDSRAAARLCAVLKGEMWREQGTNESADDFLSRMSEHFKPEGYREGDQLNYEGYYEGLFYQYKRAQELLNNLHRQPDKARVEYLGAEQLGAYMGDEQTAEEVPAEVYESHESLSASQESEIYSFFGSIKERDGEPVFLDNYEPHTRDDGLTIAEAEALDSFLGDAASVGMYGPETGVDGLTEFGEMEANSQDPLARLRHEYARKAVTNDLSLREMDAFLTPFTRNSHEAAGDQSLSFDDRQLNASMVYLKDYISQAIESDESLGGFIKALQEKAKTSGGANLAASALEALINKDPRSIRDITETIEKINQVRR